jgi:hypothetical protein
MRITTSYVGRLPLTLPDSTGSGDGTVAAVGAEVGEDVGSEAGADVGVPVGVVDEVGSDVGAEVGSEVGSDVGAEVGSEVGLEVGSLVGVMLGSVAGSVVRSVVGLVVGSVVRSGTSPGGVTAASDDVRERGDRSVRGDRADGPGAAAEELGAPTVADGTLRRDCWSWGDTSGPWVPMAMPPATTAVLAATPATAAVAAFAVMRSRTRPTRKPMPMGTVPTAAEVPR